jgi:hypothetical protein
MQRENGVRRPRAARQRHAPARRWAPGRIARGKSDSPGRNALQRESPTGDPRPGKPAPKPTGHIAVRLAVRSAAATLAPWKQAIAAPRAAERAARAAAAQQPHAT